jgi:hypothetical protein
VVMVAGGGFCSLNMETWASFGASYGDVF